MSDIKEKNSYLIGQRVIAIRNTTGLSRRKFAQVIQIPFGTVQNWENARYGGLKESGAKRLATALSEHLNIHITESWLLHGAGQPPVFPNLIINQSISNEDTIKSEDEIIQQELLLFHKLNPNSLDAIVSDNFMEPIFSKNDHIAGLKKIKFVNQDLNKNCIVKVSEDETIVRKLTLNKSENTTFDLVAYKNGKNITTHKAIKILYYAPIVWARKLIKS